MTTEITYNGELRTRAIHIKSGDTIITDAPTDNQGKGEAFSPTDLVAAALGTCVLTIMGIAARKHGYNIEGAKAAVTKTMTSNPRRIAKLETVITMPSNDFDEEVRRILNAAAQGVPVTESLHPDTEIVIDIRW